MPDSGSPPHLVSLGEALAEFSLRPDSAYALSVGGDVFNTSFHASRLGLRTGLISAIGHDPFTPTLTEAISATGIDATHVLRLADRLNGIYFIQPDQLGRRTFHFRRDGSAATQTLARCDLASVARFAASSEYFLLTGVGLWVLRDSLDLLATLLHEINGRTQIVFDTNYRSGLWDSPVRYIECMEALILPYADILLPTDDDLLSTYCTTGRAATPGDALRRIASFGARTVVMKAGELGCAVWRNNTPEYHPPPAPVRVVDSTGAGDAFNAGFLAGLVRGMSVTESCVIAQQTAAQTLGVQGATGWSKQTGFQTL